jgi:nucleoid-associated protein YgaU
MSFRYLLAAIPLLLAIGAGLGVGWYVNERFKPEPTVASPAAAPEPAADRRTSSVDPAAREAAPAVGVDPAHDPKAGNSEPEIAMTASAGGEVRAEASGGLDDAPALAHDAEDRIEPAAARQLAAVDRSVQEQGTSGRETARGVPDRDPAEAAVDAVEDRAAPGQDEAAREGAGQATTTAPAPSGDADSPKAPLVQAPPHRAATSSPPAPSSAASAPDEVATVAPDQTDDVGAAQPAAEPDEGRFRADASAAHRPQKSRSTPSAARDDAEESVSMEAREAEERNASLSRENTATIAARPDERPERQGGGGATVAADTAGEDAAPGFSFDLKAIGERIALLFGRGQDEAAPSTEETAAATAGRRPSDAAPLPADPSRRSLSEASVRQAVRAAVASDPDVQPAPGPHDKVESPAEDRGTPSFDIVRLERDGSAVIAGRAGPGAKVEVRAGTTVIDRVTADRRGNWVSIPADKLTAGEHILSLAAFGDKEPVLESPGVVVIRVPGPPPPQPAEVRLAEGPPPQPAATAVREPAAEEPLAILPAVSTSEPIAVLLPREGGGAGRILQAPGRIESDGELALLVLDYDREGRVQIAGEGPAGAPILIYVDNAPAGKVVVAQDGTWRTLLDEQLGPGTYALRLDQLDPDGSPAARLETPFTRVDQPPREGDDMDIDYVVVQPGNSLWRIARRLSGEGMRYVHIYESNQGQIRDPDLIYPGQVFAVPPSFGSAG